MIQILKFGGTSVGTSERIKTAVEIITARARRHKVVAVFSAMGGVTNEIIQAMENAERDGVPAPVLLETLRERHLLTLKAVSDTEHHAPATRQIDHWLGILDRKLQGIALLRECSPRISAVVMSIGEQLSLPILGAALRTAGLRVQEHDPATLIRTRRRFPQAEVDFAASESLIRKQLEPLAMGDVAITSGFIGATAEGDVTTLGRGGSDYTAALIGGALNAELVEIWTDVNGVLSADPRRITDAVTLSDISYGEASEMAFYGAKVLHSKTMAPLSAKNIALVIRNTFQPDHPGTRIVAKPGDSLESSITAISAVDDVAVISIEQDPGRQTPVIPALLNAIAVLEKPLLTGSFGFSEASLRLAVKARHAEQVIASLRKHLDREFQLGQILDIHIERDLSILAVVGKPDGLQNGNLARLFETFSRLKIPVKAVASGASNHSLTVFLKRVDLDRAIQALHDVYFNKPKSKAVQMQAAACA